MAVSAIMGAISTASAIMTAGSVAAFSFLGMTGFSAVAASFLATTAMGAALNALTPKPSFGQSRGFTLQGESGAALDHQIIYGQVRVGGARIYDASTGTNNEYLHRILAFAGHEVNSYQQIWINDAYVSNLENTGTDGNGYVIYNVKQVTDPDGTTSNRYDGLIRIKQYLGTTNQPADANLVTDTASLSLTAGRWTSDHKLSGVAYLYVRFKFNADAFPNGVPSVSAIIRGKKVYDPRTATTVWSDNPALCIRDYLTSDYGMSVATSRIDDTRVSTAANICEQSVESEERYTCNGAFVTSLTPGQILTDLLTSMGGLLWYAQGEWRMKAAAYTSPVLALDEDDLRSQISVSTRHSRRDGFNKVKGTFRGPDTDWQQTDYPAVASIVSAGSFVVGQPYTITSVGTTNFTLIGASSNTVGVTFTATGAGSGTGKADYFLGLDNGLVNVLDYNLPFTASSKTAQRIARIALNRNREQLTVSASFGMRAFAVQVGDIITLTNSRFGWSNKEFEVLSWTFGLTEGLDIQVQMTLRETSSSVFTSVNGESFSQNNTTLPNPFAFPAPTGLTIADGGFTSADGTFVNSLIISWTPPANAFVDYYELEWKRTSDSVYNSVDVSGTQYQASPVQETINYTIRVRAVSTLGVRSPYASTTYTAGGDVTAPGLPTSISATGAFKYITIRWTNPADADLSHVEVYENTTNTSVGATLVGTSAGDQFIRSNLGLNVTRFYFLKAVDYSGNKSAFTTGVSATTTYLDDPDFANGIYSLFTAQGLYAIRDVTSLPGSGAFVGEKVYNRTDGKLYQWTGTAWTLVIADVAAGSITETKIANDAITTPKIAANAVTATEIAAATITGNKIVANTITGGLLATSGIITTSAQIGDALITNAKIQNAAITSAKISGTIQSDNYVAGTSGWKITRDTGTAEFQSATIRGTLNAGDITAGTISADRLPGLAVANSTSITGTIARNATSTYTVSFSGVKSGSKMMVVTQIRGYSSGESPRLEVTATGTNVTLDYSTSAIAWIFEGGSYNASPATFVSTATSTSTSGTIGFTVKHINNTSGSATVDGVVAALVMEA